MPTAAASITSRLSKDLTVTMAIPRSIIFPNPSSPFTRLLTRSTKVRSRYNLAHFLLSLGTGGCRRGLAIMGSLSLTPLTGFDIITDALRDGTLTTG